MEKETIWYAKDEDGYGIISNHKMTRDKDGYEVWTCDIDASYISPDDTRFYPELDWKDEPIRIKITKVE